MKTFNTFFIIAIAMLFSVAHAQVYRCTADGRTVFSDQPCGSDAVVIEVKPAAGGGDQAAAANRAAVRQENIESMVKERRLREVEREIRLLEALVREQNQAMEREILSIRESMRYSTNNLAGATRDVSLTQEMQAVAHRYQVQAEANQARLAFLRTERQTLMR